MEEIICSICCESVRTVPSIGEEVKTTLNLNQTPTKVCLLLCNHLFHSKCILMHLNHKRNCPNCRSLVAADKMIFIPDALITMEKVQTDFGDLNLKNVGLPRDMVLKRLHKDLQQREEQIEELELRLEHGQYLDDSGNENFEVRHELETQRLENIHLSAEVARVRNELGSVKIDLERSSMNVSKQRWQISQQESKIKVP